MTDQTPETSLTEAEQIATAEALDDLVFSRGVALDDERLEWLAEWIDQRQARAVAEVVERVEAVLPSECWTYRSADVTCIDLIGGAIAGGSATWTAEMCCLPCRVLAALPSTATQEADDRG